MTKCRD